MEVDVRHSQGWEVSGWGMQGRQLSWVMGTMCHGNRHTQVSGCDPERPFRVSCHLRDLMCPHTHAYGCSCPALMLEELEGLNKLMTFTSQPKRPLFPHLQK